MKGYIQMTHKNKTISIATLQFKTKTKYRDNLEELLQFIETSTAKLIIAPELCLTNFDYEHFEEVAEFYYIALDKLLKVISDKILVLTMTKKENQEFFNQAIVIHNNKILHRQNKYRLFTLGEETKYFKAGLKDDIVKFNINGISYGILICFELRFKELWRELEGTDIILIPARWGKSRKRHLEILSQALAIMNQTFVVVSNSADDDMASSSAIISPWGEIYIDDSLEYLQKNIVLKEIKKTRRVINMN